MAKTLLYCQKDKKLVLLNFLMFQNDGSQFESYVSEILVNKNLYWSRLQKNATFWNNHDMRFNIKV